MCILSVCYARGEEGKDGEKLLIRAGVGAGGSG